jgi:TPR repeat protein
MRSALILMLLAAPAVAADVAQGERLYDAGQWREASVELTPLAEQGQAAAQFLLGAMLLDGGNGLAKDRGRAMTLLTRAAEQQHPGALFELYLAHHPPESLRWAERLAAQGNRLQGHNRHQAALCAEVLGLEHMRGLAVPRDTVKGRAWLAVAVELGRNESKPILAELDSTLSPDERARAQALASTLTR